MSMLNNSKLSSVFPQGCRSLQLESNTNARPNEYLRVVVNGIMADWVRLAYARHENDAPVDRMRQAGSCRAHSAMKCRVCRVTRPENGGVSSATRERWCDECTQQDSGALVDCARHENASQAGGRDKRAVRLLRAVDKQCMSRPLKNRTLVCRLHWAPNALVECNRQ